MQTNELVRVELIFSQAVEEDFFDSFRKEKIVFKRSALLLSFLNILNEIKVEKYIQKVAKINQLLFPIDSHPNNDKSIVHTAVNIMLPLIPTLYDLSINLADKLVILYKL